MRRRAYLGDKVGSPLGDAILVLAGALLAPGLVFPVTTFFNSARAFSASHINHRPPLTSISFHITLLIL